MNLNLKLSDSLRRHRRQIENIWSIVKENKFKRNRSSWFNKTNDFIEYNFLFDKY
jgi:hypothetical protein